MTEDLGPRKLAAIVSIDMAGFSAMTEIDEAQALAAVSRLRGVLEGAALVHGGRIFNTAGDGFMLEFCSAAGALGAVEVLWSSIDRVSVRVGIHVGDVLQTQTGDLLGHSVNVAARLQQLAEPGDVVVSLDVRRAVRGKLAQRLHHAGSVQLDKMAETLDIFTLEDVAAQAPPKRRAEPVLAVLPFDNESDAAEMDHFAEGVADEIISTLMRQSNAKVIGRTTAFQFKGERKTGAAAALKASHVLDGSVRCSGARLRVSVQLIEAATGVALWSERYDGDRGDAFALEDDIAAKVAAAMKRSLTPSERARTPVDPAARELYLRARQIWLMMSDIEEDQASVLLERCVALAPDFADAWGTLATVRALLLPRDRDMIDQPAHAAALEAAERALSINPDCAQGLVALSLLKPAFGEHGEKLRLVNEALKRTPNDPALHVARAAWLYCVGRLKDAAKALELASLLDPLGPSVDGLRASLHTARGDLRTAQDIIAAAWMRWPDSSFTWYLAFSTYCAAGRVEEAETLLAPGAPPKYGVSERDVEVLQRNATLLRLNPNERRIACARLLDTLARETGALPLSTCILAAGAGCADQAFDVINAALDAGRPLKPDDHEGFGMARSQTALQLFASVGGEPLWKHPRFPGLCARLGLAQYWVESGKWPDCAGQVDCNFATACVEAIGP